MSSHYIVETSIGDGWENTWHENAGIGNPTGTPVTFESRAEAEAALKAHIDDIDTAVLDGHMSSPEDIDDYRIRKVNKNDNCLEDVGCPECNSDGPFFIDARITVLVSDDGTEDQGGDYEWADDSYCRCKKCEFSGKLIDFRLYNHKEKTDAEL